MAFSVIVVSDIECDKSFEWNVEAELVVTKPFQWYVGEGPLFWWRIDFMPKDCPPNMCVSGISDCTFSSPLADICCQPVCQPDGCISQTREVWHILATSPEHLCCRIDECCNRRPGGFIKRLQKYSRPALCCDVDKATSFSDTYEEVDFMNICCFASFIDPCDAQVQFPCPEQACVVPAITPMAIQPGYFVEPLMDMEIPSGLVSNRFGGALPSALQLKHNLFNAGILSSFLGKNKFELPGKINLAYNEANESWERNFSYTTAHENWKIIFECRADVEHTDAYGWKFNLSVCRNLDSGTTNSRAIFYLTSRPFVKNVSKFFLNFNFNTEAKTMNNSSEITAKMDILFDEIGLFDEKSWKLDPYLKVTLSLPDGS